MQLQNLDLVTAIMTAFYRLARNLPGIGLLLLSGLLFFPSALAAPCAPVDPLTGAMQVDYCPLPHHTDALHGFSRRCLEQRVAPHLNETALDRTLTAADAVQPQAAGSNWTATLRFDHLSAVAYGAGLHVAVGEDGTILTSPDGITWAMRDSGTTADLNGIIWGGHQFVTVGEENTILTSPDGVTWTHREPGTTAHLNSIAWGGGQFVAVGQGTILTSLDGVTWTVRISGTCISFIGITWIGNQFFVFDYNTSTFLTSPDGVTWTLRDSGTTAYLKNILFKDIIWTSSQFVAVGHANYSWGISNIIFTSPDGVTWTERYSGLTHSSFTGIAWGGGQFVAVGTSGTILTSPDGITWTLRDSGTTAYLNDITWTGSQFVAVGWTGEILTSSDGVNWTTARAYTISYLSDITWGGGQFVAVGEPGAILTSPDGVTWTRRDSETTAALGGIIWGGGQFVVVGRSIDSTGSPIGKILTSPDGVTWTERNPGTTAALGGITWGGGQFVAVGNSHDSYTSTILTSPDGVTWTERNWATGSHLNLNAITWGGGQFVAVGSWFGSESGSGTMILTSPDGVTWTERDSIANSALYDIAWTGSQFVAVGSRGIILTSPDGVTWTEINPGITGYLQGITWGGGQFVAVGRSSYDSMGSGTILTSPDGVTWTAENTGTSNSLSGVASNGRQFVAVGRIILLRSSQGSAVGVFRDGDWFLDANGNGQWDGCQQDGGQDACFFNSFSQAGDLPVVGDWNGDGKAKMGVFRNGSWFLDANGNGQWEPCGTAPCFLDSFGMAGDLPVAGDWNGDGKDEVGVFRNGSWFLDANGNSQWDGCGADRCYVDGFGMAGDLPVAGDWNGDGKDEVGVFRNGSWFLDSNGNGQWDGCGVDQCHVDSFGIAGDLPVVGDWNGDGKAKVGVYRNGSWYFDANGNGQWDGCGVDQCSVESFGITGDLPVAGKW